MTEFASETTCLCPACSAEDPALLLKHAEMMWDAEVRNFQRYDTRGKMIVASTTAMIGFISTIAIISNPSKSVVGLEGAVFWASLSLLVVGFLFIVSGFYGLITSAMIFVNHNEEDAGSLPNPDQFAEIGELWWATQPTLGTVEERYVLALAVRRLTWITSRGSKLNKYRMRFLRWRCGRKVYRLRDQIFVELRNNESLFDYCKKRLERYFKYNGSQTDPPGMPTYASRRDRGPRDVASLILAIYIYEQKRKQGRVAAKKIIDGITSDFRCFLRKVSDHKHCCCCSESGGGDARYSEEIDKYIFPGSAFLGDGRGADLLHPSIMVRSSSYYLQFAEAFSWRFLGKSKTVSGTENPTGSGRTYSVLDVRHLQACKFSEEQWRMFTSTYFAAQNLRSTNWNLWFRVKRAERRFLFSLSFVYLAFVFVSLGMGVAAVFVSLGMGRAAIAG